LVVGGLLVVVFAFHEIGERDISRLGEETLYRATKYSETFCSFTNYTVSHTARLLDC